MLQYHGHYRKAQKRGDTTSSPEKAVMESALLRAISTCRSNYKGGHYTYVCSDHFPHGDGHVYMEA